MIKHLRRMTESDWLHVDGDLNFLSETLEIGYFSEGFIEVGGNFYQKGKGDTFFIGEGFTLAFVGEETQLVYVENLEQFNQFQIPSQYSDYVMNDEPLVCIKRLAYYICKGILEGMLEATGIAALKTTTGVLAAELGVIIQSAAGAGIALAPPMIQATSLIILPLISAVASAFASGLSIKEIVETAQGSEHMYEKARLFAKNGTIVLISTLSMVDDIHSIIKSYKYLKTVYGKSEGAGLEDSEELLDYINISDIDTFLKRIKGKVNDEAYGFLEKNLVGYNATQLADLA